MRWPNWRNFCIRKCDDHYHTRGLRVVVTITRGMRVVVTNTRGLRVVVTITRGMRVVVTNTRVIRPYQIDFMFLGQAKSG